ncbi:MAG: TonB-dependent receptor [Gammaproteobacteria bacterium]
MFKQLSVFCTSTVLAIAISTPAMAQLEEVLVTATKRETTLQDIPVAVTVTSGETMQQAQIIDISDLQSIVPSLRITQLQSSGNTNFVIRGFGNGANNPGIEPSVGVFIDGVYRSRSSGAISDLTNIERVEVLRGPQSTLFGKNASAGVISVVTTKPSFEFGGGGELTVGNFNTLMGRAHVTGPITDKLAFRVSASGNQREGYFGNGFTNNNTNERERWGLRGELLFEPTDNSSWRLIADLDVIDENCCGVTNLVDGPTGDVVRALGGQLTSNDPFSRSGFFNLDSINDIENSGISLQGDIDYDRFTLTTITSVRGQEKYENADSDFNSADLLGANQYNTDIDTFTQEFRLTSNGGGNVDWMVGAFYFNEEVEYQNNIIFGQDFRAYADILAGGGITGLEGALGVTPGTFFGAGQGSFDRTGQDDTALSFFGQVDWHISDRTTLTFGLNNTRNEKDAFVDASATGAFSAVDLVQVGFGGLFGALTGGQAPTPANFAAFPAQFAQAQALSTVPCSPTTGPLCNSALALQPLQFLPPFVNFPNSVESGNSDDSDTTYTLRVSFAANDTYNFYASAATGFKSTSWNLSRDSRPFAADIGALTSAGLNTVNLRSGTRFASPEEATVYELGMKAQFERGAINLAIFDQSIEGFQSNIFTGTGFDLANAGEQSTTGLEVDTVFTPNDQWKFTFAGTFLDPTYDSFVNGNGVNGPEDLTGRDPAGIHKVSINTSGTYYHDFGNGLEGFVRADYSYEDEVQIVENVSADVASREVNLLNASFGLNFDNGFELLLWGRNLTNDDHLLSAFPTVLQSGSFSGYPNPPRTYGLTVRKSF